MDLCSTIQLEFTVDLSQNDIQIVFVTLYVCTQYRMYIE